MDPLFYSGSGKGDAALTGGVFRMTGTRFPLLELEPPMLDSGPVAVTPGSGLITPCLALVIALVTHPDPLSPGFADCESTAIFVLIEGE